jgi:hypothetical protein
MNAAQIVSELAKVDSAVMLPAASFNDEDFYVFETESLMFVRKIGRGNFALGVPTKAPAGCSVVKGIRAKNLGLWMYM